MEIEVVVAAAQPILREGLACRLEDVDGLRAVAQAGDGEALGRALDAHPGCVAVVALDLPAPAGGGADAFDAIRRCALGAESRCVALSRTNARRHLERAMRSGATGYVLEESPLDELLRSLREVAAGRSYVCRGASRYLVDVVNEGRPDPEGWFALTRRECEVLEGIVSGRSCPELASELGISPRTVERHRASVMAKLDIHKTAKLVRFAVREGLVAA